MPFTYRWSLLSLSGAFVEIGMPLQSATMVAVVAPGIASKKYVRTIRAEIIDKLGATATFAFDIVVKPTSEDIVASSSTTVLSSSVAALSSDLDALSSAGNVNRFVQRVAQVSDTLSSFSRSGGCSS